MKETQNIERSLIPYDQREIETVMKQLLLKNGVTDVLYEGSNVSQLTSVISYAISTLNINTAINLQETILPLATKRMNVLFGARQLGYEPHDIISYKYELAIVPKYNETKITVTPTGEELLDRLNKDKWKPAPIKSYTLFKSNGKEYWYRGPEIEFPMVSNYDLYMLDDRNNPTRCQIERKIEVTEGKLIKAEDDAELVVNATTYIEDGIEKIRQDFLVPYTNAEDSEGIFAYLSYVDDDGTNVVKERWTRSESILIDETVSYTKNNFVRQENIILGYPAVFFEYAGLGNKIQKDTIIEFEVLQSSGPDGEAESEFKSDQPFIISSYREVQRGQLKESLKSIKENAVVFNNTANRAVTRMDYKVILKRHTMVDEADAWGGEEETPRVKGEIWMSVVPDNRLRPFEYRNQDSKKSIYKTEDSFELDLGNFSMNPADDVKGELGGADQLNFRNWYLTPTQQYKLKDYLSNFKIMTMGLNYRHPLYVDFEYDMSIVKYDIQKSHSEMNRNVFNVIYEYFVRVLENFDSEYIDSNLQRTIDDLLGRDSGINYSLKLYGVLIPHMVDEYWARDDIPELTLQAPHWELPKPSIPPKPVPRYPVSKKRILVNVAFPYDNVIPTGLTGPIDTSVLPKIDTESFGPLGLKLWADFNTFNPEGTVRTCPIYFGKRIVGHYRVDITKHIIELDFDMSNPSVTGNGTIMEDFFGPNQDQYARFDIQYAPYDSNIVNIAFTKNVIPRLKKIAFTY